MLESKDEDSMRLAVAICISEMIDPANLLLDINLPDFTKDVELEHAKQQALSIFL
jgi:hypothetical protein